jgi:hypothetical protein
VTAFELAVRRVALTGLGGVGKPQLAVEHAYWQQADHDRVLRVRGEQLATLPSDRQVCGTRRLEYPVSLNHPVAVYPQTRTSQREAAKLRDRLQII